MSTALQKSDDERAVNIGAFIPLRVKRDLEEKAWFNRTTLSEEIRRAIGQSKVSQDRAIGIARKTDLADQAPSSMNCGSASYTAAKAVNIDLNQVINPICDL